MSAIEELRDRLELGRVVVPPHMKVLGGKLVRVKGYSYTRRGGKKRVVLSDKPAPGQDVWARNPARAVDFEDQRSSPGAKVEIDPERLNAAMLAAGVVGSKNLKIKLRIRDQAKAGQQGMAQKIGPEEYRVVISVAPKARLENNHLYVLNNSLVHEMRHVAQHQEDPDMGFKYAQALKSVGYSKNPYEAEARAFGRLADHSGEKEIPAGLGPALGESVWGIVPRDTILKAGDFDAEEFEAALEALADLSEEQLAQVMETGSPVERAAAQVLLSQ